MSDSLLLDAKQLAALLSIATKTIRRWDSAGRLPRPVRLSSGCVRWSRSTIESWIAEGEQGRAKADEARSGLKELGLDDNVELS